MAYGWAGGRAYLDCGGWGGERGEKECRAKHTCGRRDGVHIDHDVRDVKRGVKSGDGRGTRLAHRHICPAACRRGASRRRGRDEIEPLCERVGRHREAHCYGGGRACRGACDAALGGESCVRRAHGGVTGGARRV